MPLPQKGTISNGNESSSNYPLWGDTVSFHRGVTSKFCNVVSGSGLTTALRSLAQKNEPGTLNNHFLMDVWWNNQLLRKVWNHPTETNNKKWLFRVPGTNQIFLELFFVGKSPKIWAASYIYIYILRKTNFTQAVTAVTVWCCLFAWKPTLNYQNC